MTNHIGIVGNIDAASDDSLRESIVELRSADRSVSMRVTWESGDGARFAMELAEMGVRILLIAGGDGLLNEVVNALVGREDLTSHMQFGVLPYGTGNDFATGCGIEVSEPSHALALNLNDFEPVEIDVGRVGDRSFVNMASTGFGVEATSEAPSELKKILGSSAYFFRAIGESLRVKARRVAIQTSELDWKGKMLFACVGNGKQTGGGWSVCPEARLDDGLLDLLVIPELPYPTLLSLANDLTREGRHVDHEAVIYTQTPWIEIRGSDPLQVNLDGEPFFEKELRFEASPKAITFLLPPGAVEETKVS